MYIQRKVGLAQPTHCHLTPLKLSPASLEYPLWAHPYSPPPPPFPPPPSSLPSFRPSSPPSGRLSSAGRTRCNRRRRRGWWSRWTSSSALCRRPSAARSPCTCSRRRASWGTSAPSRRRSGPRGPAGHGPKPPWPIRRRCTAVWWERTGSSRGGGRASRRWWTWSSQPCKGRRGGNRQWEEVRSDLIGAELLRRVNLKV